MRSEHTLLMVCFTVRAHAIHGCLAALEQRRSTRLSWTLLLCRQPPVSRVGLGLKRCPRNASAPASPTLLLPRECARRRACVIDWCVLAWLRGGPTPVHLLRLGSTTMALIQALMPRYQATRMG